MNYFDSGCHLSFSAAVWTHLLLSSWLPSTAEAPPTSTLHSERDVFSTTTHTLTETECQTNTMSIAAKFLLKYIPKTSTTPSKEWAEYLLGLWWSETAGTLMSAGVLRVSRCIVIDTFVLVTQYLELNTNKVHWSKTEREREEYNSMNLLSKQTQLLSHKDSIV